MDLFAHISDYTPGFYPPNQQNRAHPLYIEPAPYQRIPDKIIHRPNDRVNDALMQYFGEFLFKYPNTKEHHELAYLDFATQIHIQLQEIWHWHYEYKILPTTNRLKPLYDLYLQHRLDGQAEDNSFLGFDTWVRAELITYDKWHP